jgi:hypothetical protein
MATKKELEGQIEDLSKKITELTGRKEQTSNREGEITLDNVVTHFLKEFPQVADNTEYAGEASEYADIAYTFFGVLNTILLENVEKKRELQSVYQIVRWVDTLYNNPALDTDVKNLFAIEFFEKADESKEYSDFLSANLTGITKEDLETHVKFHPHQ